MTDLFNHLRRFFILNPSSIIYIKAELIPLGGMKGFKPFNCFVPIVMKYSKYKISINNSLEDFLGCLILPSLL